MTEEAVKQIVAEEIGRLFGQMQDDITNIKRGQERIERVLLGDKDYEDDGMASQVKFAYTYARKNTESRLIERACPAIEHYERYEKNGFWDSLEQMIDGYKVWKWLIAFTGVGTLMGLINIAFLVIDLINATH